MILFDNVIWTKHILNQANALKRILELIMRTKLVCCFFFNFTQKNRYYYFNKKISIEKINLLLKF